MSSADTHLPKRQSFERLSGADNLSDTENESGRRMVTALSLTKVSDGLLDPKLVLSWLLNALGAPGVLIGALVPIREAGALLPQGLLSARLQRLEYRKRMWVAGSAVQGLAALAIAACGLLLDGWPAGLGICLALAVLAVARAGCSVSFKEVQGKLVGRSRRGAVTGAAASAGAAGVVVFAVLLMLGLLEDRLALVLAVGLAGVLWISAAVVFAGLPEAPSKTRDDDRGTEFARLWSEDWLLRRFVVVRALLVTTALAPPYLVMLSAGQGEGVLRSLGTLVLASALASLLSSYVWGRLSDRSARLVLCLSGVVGGIAMAAMVGLSLTPLKATIWAAPLVLFVLMIAYHGVRQARSTYLVDMSPKDFRGNYAAIANTAVGGVLLVGGLLGAALAMVGAELVLACFAVLSVIGGGLAMTLYSARQLAEEA
ncbi:MFS transporter [Pseudooceanicola sp. CBS1P-1]|uniref:MFS transporter n=1 Tax=Pseudooceanicola albus TaxID=2692189 RepID=A0A6L7G190_9RHOB|nr:MULTISPECIES: MFS transporter [Pseudooceanicola]MBT9382720.1 MFS transporter [Pseudooceanicola endophyticus]MXN17258.1 MFS transporter [Pseudooceanicola albus]